MIKKYLFSVVILFFVFTTNAQKVNVNVNHFTGTVNLDIPLYTVQSGACAMPVGLVYSTNGVKVQNSTGLTGIDWQLKAGGEIKRELRGLPDDCKKDLSNNVRLGWLYNTKGTAINNFTIANDNNNSTCTDEAADINYINTNFSDLADTEPDIFYVNAPGLSCRMVFDNNHVIRTIPYKDVKITYATDTSGKINSFTIVNDKGVTYVFSDIEVTKKSSATLGLHHPYGTLFFNNEKAQYGAGINYNSTWRLNSMTDINGNFIKIGYMSTDLPYLYDRSTVSSIDSLILIQETPANGTQRMAQFKRALTYVPMTISDIWYGNGGVSNLALLIKSDSVDYHSRVLRSIVGFGREIKLNGLQLLSSLYLPGNVAPYTFNYSKTIPDPQWMVPDSSSNQMDLWGYFNIGLSASLKPQVYVNPSNSAYERYRYSDIGTAGTSFPYLLNGNPRGVDPVSIIGGTLNQITYPGGGTTTFTYEPNDFYDSTAGKVIQGGGVRIKQITTYDGVNTANNIVRNFTYTNPSTGFSSGKPISLPVLAFTIPYTGTGTTQDLWNYSTVRSEGDLSPEDNTIIYSHVKESQTGGGSTLYEFTTPATNWDLSAGTDWTPTVVNMARPNCNSFGFIRNDIRTYPFPPNPNYEFERGLSTKVTRFNDAGNEVSETSYTYQRTGSPIIVTGFKWEDNLGIKAYAKYKILTSVGELLSQEVNKVFDSSTLTTAQQTTTKIYYNSLQHKLPTLVERVNSDGSIKRSYTAYSKDFNTTSATEATAIALGNLQALNVNTPVEVYTKSERSGVNKTIGAELIKYNTFNPAGAMGSQYQPSQKLSFSDANGVTDFAPSSVTSGVFVKDPRYIVRENYQTYDFAGSLQTGDDNNRNVQTLITDYHSMQIVAAIKGAAIEEIAYNDFDSKLSDCGFKKDNSTYSYSSSCRTGKNALALEALAGLSRTIKKNVNADNYIFSVWVNTTIAGNITLTLTNTSNQVSTYNLALANSAGSWKYYELKVPVTTMSTSFTARFQSDQAILIDDVLFYPENAEVSTAAYDPTTFLKTAETNTNGVSKYYSYDGLGRLRYVYDQDKQIVAKKTYVRKGTQAGSINFTYTVTSNTNGQSSVTFNGSSAEETQDGLTYTWDFGDGSAPVTTTSSSLGHLYTKAGAYSVKLTATSPFYDKLEVTQTVNIAATFPIFYIKNTTNGKITSLQFYKDGVMVYNFSEADLIAGPVALQGAYTVKIYYSKVGGVSFKSIGFRTSLNGDGCINTSLTPSPASLTVDLSGISYLNVVVDTANCLL